MSLTSDQNSETYDAVVVGASFAGLSFASGAAARGMRVLVLERDAEIGAVVRTTGVLFSDVLDIADVPRRYLMNSVRRVRIQAPNQPPIEIGAQAFRFYMADVPGMLRWMAEQAEAHGATIRCGTPFLDATPEGNGWMRVSFGGPSESDGNGTATRTPRGTVLGRIVIGADGSRSTVARQLGLDQNTRFLSGAEWLVADVPLDGETFYLVMDHQLAPGYAAWLAPHGEITAFGVAGRLREFKPAESLRLAVTAFQDVADLSQMQVVERKAGVIPVGGRLKRVYRDDAKGHALLLGDAAGLCGAATGGGIYPALISGRLAAHAVANEILNGVPGAIRKYLRDLPQAARLGHYLQIEDWLRWVLDRMGSNADVAALYGLLGSGEGKRVLQSALLETPIIGMDSSFFGLLRGVLSKHPSVYSSAIRMAWQRVRTRA